MIDTARPHGAGLFVLALTSNKEGPEVQDARPRTGHVAGRMIDHLRKLNADAQPLGSFGAVVGATIGETAIDFACNGPILAPGFGAQGGTARHASHLRRRAPLVVPSSSREVLGAGPTPPRCAPRPRGRSQSSPGSWAREAARLRPRRRRPGGHAGVREHDGEVLRRGALRAVRLGEMVNSDRIDALLSGIPLLRSLAKQAPTSSPTSGRPSSTRSPGSTTPSTPPA